MTCYYPKPAFLSPIGESGKRKLSFQPRAGWNSVLLPCGKCVGCRLDHSSQWAHRLVHESKMHEQSCFITLTYEDQHLPPYGSLSKRDYQLFLKKLRQHLHKENGIKIRYFLVGEYGDQTKRPHYHAIIFGWFPQDAKLKYKNKQGDRLYSSETLTKIWGKGLADFGQVTYKSAAYCARYTLKKSGGKFPVGHYQRLDVETGEVIQLEPEFAKMSTHPGIGKTFYEKFSGDIHNGDYSIVEGRKHRPPRYYDKLLQLRSPERYEQIKTERRIKSDKQSDNNTTARLRVREIVKKSQISTLKRSL